MKKNNNSNFLFDLIAPIYGLFYGFQKNDYRGVLDKMQNNLDLTAYKNIIDVGCGTGALCSVLNQKGVSVTGIDPAQRMLNIAARKNENKAIKFVQASALEKLPFKDKNFDVSIASYVAHGLQAHERKIMYAEMNRITKDLVIIYDYNANRAILINIIEWLEGGDYFNFIRNAKREMEEYFQDIRVINVDLQAAWYICSPIASGKAIYHDDTKQ